MEQLHTKYPRTLHLPWSPGRSRDDLVLASTDHFENTEVVVTEKRDGENTTLYRDTMHARSLDSGFHDSRSWVAGLRAQIGYMIPSGWRVCGENLYAQHSIAYQQLASYFEVFSIWDASNYALSWNETEEWAEILGLRTVPVVYRGPWIGEKINEVWADHCAKQADEAEGYVVRLARSFSYDQFGQSVAKYVRPDHVQTDTHWKKNWKPNQLAKEQ